MKLPFEIMALRALCKSVGLVFCDGDPGAHLVELPWSASCLATCLVPMVLDIILHYIRLQKVGELGCRMMYAVVPHFFGLEWEDGHVPIFWLLQKLWEKTSSFLSLARLLGTVACALIVATPFPELPLVAGSTIESLPELIQGPQLLPTLFSHYLPKMDLKLRLGTTWAYTSMELNLKALASAGFAKLVGCRVCFRVKHQPNGS